MVIGAAGAVGVALPPQAAAIKPSPANAADINRLCMLAPSLLRGWPLLKSTPTNPWI
jgi:hypothetical protein